MRSNFLFLAVVATASAFAPTACPARLRARASYERTSRPAALLDLFGKKPKKEEGALVTGLDALVKDAPLPVKLGKKSVCG